MSIDLEHKVCTRKRAYSTAELAYKVCRRRNHGEDDETLKPYKCPFCGRFHLGADHRVWKQYVK